MSDELPEDRLLQWADVLDIPSGLFVKDDLRWAATELTRLRAERDRLREDVAQANLRRDEVEKLFDKWHTKAAEENARALSAESAAARLREALEKIAEFASGDGATLGAIARVAQMQSMAYRAINVPDVPCPVCDGSGFNGNGSGYDAVCDNCGGTRYLPAFRAALIGTGDGWRPTHRHVQRGTEYVEIARGAAQVSHHPIEDYTAVSIYRDREGQWWVRNAVEFDDGRFVALPTAPDTGNAGGGK
jgi:hypothetical protein